MKECKHKRYRKNHKDRINEQRKRWEEHNAHKRRAHTLFRRALKAGIILKPTTCEKCLKSASLEGHHPDYSRPLEVMWLCRKCHRAEHKHDVVIINRRKGIRSPNTRLTEEIVKTIKRELAAPGANKTAIAKKYKISRALTYQIETGRVWKNII